MMSQKTVILTVVLFAILVLGMFIYASLRQDELGEEKLQHEVYA
jgi:hypothetical protein